MEGFKICLITQEVNLDADIIQSLEYFTRY
jgi:hypothetical protein